MVFVLRLYHGLNGIGGPGFVDRHAGTLSLNTGDVSEGETNYLWALPFLVVRIPWRETPPRTEALKPRRWAGTQPA